MVQRLVALAVAVGAAALGLSHAAKRQRLQALQHAFTRFHERIRHEQSGERGLLRDRREALTARLKEVLPQELKPRTFDQGSYKLQTGVKPLAGEFDIDFGLVLECPRTFFSGPVEAKERVRAALLQGSRRVRIRRSCVTVEYTDKELGDYHIDIAVYVKEPHGEMFLAKGKEHSKPEYKFWEPAAPEELTELVNGRFSGLAVGQFRRCVRYLKRWKHVNFETKFPYSIALTIAAYDSFEPALRGFLDDEPDDAQALAALTRKMLDAAEGGRLVVKLPVSPRVDLMERLAPSQMQRFLERLQALNAALDVARKTEDAEAALQTLREQFGPEFG